MTPSLHGTYNRFSVLNILTMDVHENAGSLRLYQFRRLAEPFAAPLAEISLKPGEFIAMRAFAWVCANSGFFGVHEIALLWSSEALMVLNEGKKSIHE